MPTSCCVDLVVERLRRRAERLDRAQRRRDLGAVGVVLRRVDVRARRQQHDERDAERERRDAPPWRASCAGADRGRRGRRARRACRTRAPASDGHDDRQAQVASRARRAPARGRARCRGRRPRRAARRRRGRRSARRRSRAPAGARRGSARPSRRPGRRGPAPRGAAGSTDSRTLPTSSVAVAVERHERGRRAGERREDDDARRSRALRRAVQGSHATRLATGSRPAGDGFLAQDAATNGRRGLDAVGSDHM